MFVISVVLVLVAFVTLMLGVLGMGDDPLQFVYASIGACLVAAVFLAVGVLRARPSRKPLAAPGPGGQPSSWSGATPWASVDAETPGAPSRPLAGQPHVQILSARDAAAPAGAVSVNGERPAGEPARADDDSDPEATRFTEALGEVGVTGARVERLRGRFVTLAALAAASVEEIAAVPGIGPEDARRIHDRLAGPDARLG